MFWNGQWNHTNLIPVYIVVGYYLEYGDIAPASMRSTGGTPSRKVETIGFRITLCCSI